MKKIFGELNLTWKKVIIMAIVVGVIIGLLNSVPALLDTSFRDPAIYLDFWILVGILIIMNSKSNMDSALKCLVFFLISQPLIYLVEIPFVGMGWGILSYYKNWIIPTVLCFPMGYIGYYMKKDKWWGLLILLPMMGIITMDLYGYFGGVIYSFPHHLISCLFCISCLIIFPFFIFNKKKIRYIGLLIGIVLISFACILGIIKKDYIYETDILCDNEEHPINEKYKVYIEDKDMGEVSIKPQYYGNKEEGKKFYCVHSKFVKSGKTVVVLETPKGEKKYYDLEVKKNTYEIEEQKKK